MNRAQVQDWFWGRCEHKFAPGTIALAMALLLSIPAIAIAERTVMDSERGGLNAGDVYNNEWDEIGVSVNYGFTEMRPEAIKVKHGRLQLFAQFDDGQNAYFPFYKFQAFETDEIANSRNPLIVTATYQGKKRDVFDGRPPDPVPPKDKQYRPMFVSDDRFIKFWVNEYVRKIEHEPYYRTLQNLWEGMDYCLFRYDLNGVEDDNGNFVACDQDQETPGQATIPWDPPFPQNDNEWLEAIKTFFRRLKEIAPDTLTMANQGSLNDESRFPDVFADIDGIMKEFVYYYDSDADTWYRNAFYESAFEHSLWLGSINKPVLHRANLPEMSSPNFNNTLLTNYITYLILKGDNDFFAAQDSNGNEIDPSKYEDIKNALGRPSVAAESVREPGTDIQKRLYWRQYQGGIVYLNWTGVKNKIITLPTDKTYYDPNTGNAVTQITLADISQVGSGGKSAGAYVVTTPGKRAAIPQISPNGGSWAGGEVEVSLSSTTPGATIRYTLNGSEPTLSSTLYTTPFKLNSSKTLKAKSFASGYLDSFSSSTTFRIYANPPSIEFFTDADSGSEFLDTIYPLISISTPCPKDITVSYSLTGGTATKDKDFKITNGTLTFKPGERYKYFPLEIINDIQREPDETIKITLSNPVNATLGSKAVYTHTIKDNDQRSTTSGYLDIIASADTYINSSEPTVSQDPKEGMIIVGHATSGNKRGLLRFDLSPIPQGATIDSAILHTRVVGASSVNGDADQKVETSVYRLKKNWNENEVSWNKANNSTPWTAPGASASPSDRESSATATTNTDLQAWMDDFNPSWDVTEDVQDFVSGEAPNYGWLMVGSESSTSQDDFAFFAIESEENYIRQPRLMVTYTVPTELVILYGDVTGEGTVSATDASWVLMHDVGLITFTTDQIKKADVTGEGTVSAYDASLIAQKAVGLITKFPVEG